jgi:arabinofuranosyltransferase
MNADQLSDFQDDSGDPAPEGGKSQEGQDDARAAGLSEGAVQPLATGKIERRAGGSAGSAREWIPVIFATLAVAPVIGLLIDGFTFRWNDEDAFINFRIVRNLLAGDGLVFNLGERVEAGTSPLWLAILAFAGALRLPLEETAAYGGIALTVAGLFFAIDGAARATSAPNATLTARLQEPAFPVGAAIFASIPVAWDYASSGLETGLSIAWLGGSYAAVSIALARPAADRRREALTAILLGLGPLVRPELALYSAAFFAVFACALIDSKGENAGVLPARRLIEASTLRAALPRIVIAATVAAILPAGYQIFRMGYFASVVPNTAIAKEAFLTNWEQGKHYFTNFFGTYRLVVPLGFAAGLWLIQIRTAVEGGRPKIARVGFVALPVLAGAFHVLYLVRIGGDYMHGRLFLPATFALLLPVARVPLAMGGSLVRTLRIAFALGVLPWIVYCVTSLRVGVENEFDIGDERGWYARESKVRNPLRLSDFKEHTFYSGATNAESHVRAHCAKPGPDCRLVYLGEEGKITWPIGPTVDPRIDSVVSFGAIGIAGYALSSHFEVVDRHGLADPLVSHFKLGQRGRPGHEKKISDDWELARFAAPNPHEETAVTAARHALSCGALHDLSEAVKGPISLPGFESNLKHASLFAELRIPTDPFEAEELFCHTPHRPEAVTGGEGGAAFRTICREGSRLAGLRGTWKSADNAIASVQTICDLSEERGAESASTERTTPLFGEAANMPFELACPAGSVATALRGRSNNWMRSVSLTCAYDGEAKVVTTARAGAEVGNEYALHCPEGHRVIGIVGHAGALIDGLGVVCSP